MHQHAGEERLSLRTLCRRVGRQTYMACKDTDDDGAMHVRMRHLSGPRPDTDGQAYAQYSTAQRTASCYA
jgi:hypothetical protein